MKFLNKKYKKHECLDSSTTVIFMGMLLIFIIFIIFNEVMFDSSVILNKELLILTLSTILIPFIINFFTNKTVIILSNFINCIFYLTLLSNLYFNRNRIFRFYLNDGIITSKEFDSFEKIFLLPSALVIIYTPSARIFDDIKNRSTIIRKFYTQEGRKQDIELLLERVKLNKYNNRLSGLIKKGVIFIKKIPTINEINLLNIIVIGSKDFRER